MAKRSTGSKSPKKPRRGLFISFEGVDGTGKSTQIRLLAARLKKLGKRVVIFREPGGTRIGEKIRHLLQYDRGALGMAPTTETLLFCASRAQLVTEKILPALAAGKVVLTDRFMDSTSVYQGIGRNLGIQAVEKLHEFSIGRCRPDMTLVLVMRPDASLKRARKSSGGFDRMEAQKQSFYQSIHRGYATLSKREPRRFKWVCAERTRAEIHADVWKEVAKKIR